MNHGLCSCDGMSLALYLAGAVPEAVRHRREQRVTRAAFAGIGGVGDERRAA